MTVSRGRADDERLLELLAAGVGDDGELGGEALDVLGLASQVALGDEEREVGVLVAGRLDPAVELALEQLPDAVAVGADDHRPRTGPRSASSACRTSSLYQAEKSSLWG